MLIFILFQIFQNYIEFEHVPVIFVSLCLNIFSFCLVILFLCLFVIYKYKFHVEFVELNVFFFVQRLLIIEN